MHGALATLGLVVALMTAASAFVVPGPSKIISGRPTRASTSQVIVMGRGDTRTAKGKRMRHSYGKCRPQKKREVVYFDGEVVPKAAPVARRWENIEYDESTLPKPVQALAEPSVSDDAEGGVEDVVAEVAVEVPAVPFVSTPESMAAKAKEEAAAAAEA